MQEGKNGLKPGCKNKGCALRDQARPLLILRIRSIELDAAQGYMLRGERVEGEGTPRQASGTGNKSFWRRFGEGAKVGSEEGKEGAEGAEALMVEVEGFGFGEIAVAVGGVAETGVAEGKHIEAVDAVHFVEAAVPYL